MDVQSARMDIFSAYIPISKNGGTRYTHGRYVQFSDLYDDEDT